MSFSAQQAAEALGVSRMQISRLVQRGDLRAERIGNVLLIDADSVNEYRDLRPDRGRPLSARKAWELIGEHVHADRAASEDDLMSVARRLAIVGRRRAERRPYRALPNRLPALLADQDVVLSAAAAGQAHGAPVRPGDPYALYVSREHLDQLIERYRLRDSNDPNVVVRVVEPGAWVLNDRVAPPFVAAIDALDDGDARSASEIVRHMVQSAEGEQ